MVITAKQYCYDNLLAKKFQSEFDGIRGINYSLQIGARPGRCYPWNSLENVTNWYIMTDFKILKYCYLKYCEIDQDLVKH